MEDRITFIRERFLKETKYVYETLKFMLPDHMQFTVRLYYIIIHLFSKVGQELFTNSYTVQYHVWDP